MIIVNTPEKDVSNVDRKLDKRKVHAPSIKSSSTLFSYSMHAMYNIFHRVQYNYLMLKLYVTVINTLIFQT